MTSQFYFSLWRSNLISRERVHRTFCKSQFYRGFWRSNLISRKRVHRTLCKSQFYRGFWRSNLISFESIAPGREKFRSLPGFGDRTSFRAKGLRPDAGNRSFTSVFGLHCPALSREKWKRRREQEGKRARGQESKRAREQEGKRECEDVRM